MLFHIRFDLAQISSQCAAAFEHVHGVIETICSSDNLLIILQLSQKVAGHLIFLFFFLKISVYLCSETGVYFEENYFSEAAETKRSELKGFKLNGKTVANKSNNNMNNNKNGVVIIGSIHGAIGNHSLWQCLRRTKNDKEISIDMNSGTCTSNGEIKGLLDNNI